MRGKKLTSYLLALAILFLSVGCSNSSTSKPINEVDAINKVAEYLGNDILDLYHNNGEVDVDGVKYYSIEDKTGSEARFLVSLDKGEVFFEWALEVGNLIPIEEYIAAKDKEEEARKSVNLGDYKGVVKFYDESGSKIEKLLSENNIESIVSSNKSLIVSKQHSYEKFGKMYKQLFVHNIEVDFIEGVGSYNLAIDKKMHIDDSVTVEDPYIKVMYELYKSFYPNTSEAEFIEQLNNIINKAKDTGYTTSMIEVESNINIDATINDATMRLTLDIEKELEVEKVSPITKEYATISEFEGAQKEILKKYTDMDLTNYDNWSYYDEWSGVPGFYGKLGESGVKNRYTVEYSANKDSDFKEEIEFSLYNYMDKKSPKNEYSTDLYLENDTLKINDTDKAYIKKGVEKFSGITGVDIYKYMTEEEFLKEIESTYLRRQVFDGYSYTEFKDYGTKTDTSLPVPGLENLSIDFEVVPPVNSGSMQSDEYAKRQYGDDLGKLIEGNIVYVISLNMTRPVVAEGITRR
ncbi:MAG: hypothetical protein ACRCXA_08190 [Peptostreptococcaceae bacterium]